MFEATRARSGGLAFMVALLCAGAAAASAAAAVPGGYVVDKVDGPTPAPPDTLAGARTGETVINAGDMTGDGREDILVGAPSAPISPDITGRVFLFNHNGALIWEAAAPDPQPGNISGSRPTRFGAALARLGDIGSCATSGASCTVGPEDGVAELLVSAPGTDTGGGDAGRDEGAVYVLDGDTGQLLKELRLSADEHLFNGAGFGTALTSLAGAPPCRGTGGVEACGASSAVSTGDVTGDGTPDFAVGAPDYTEAGGDESVNCLTEVSCPRFGRIYVVPGELITGGSLTPLDLNSTNANVILFRDTVGQAGQPPRFGAGLAAVGDIGACTGDPAGGPTCFGVAEAVSNQPDGASDVVASAPGVDAGASDSGAAYLLDTRGNAAMVRVDPPSPQPSGSFGLFRHAFAAPGDFNLDRVPDVLIGSPDEGNGTALIVNGNVSAADRVLRTLADPAPVSGGSFGAGLAALGDITGDGGAEVAVGAAGGPRVGSVHVFSACARDVLQTVGDPDAQADAAFGAAVAPLGDRNGDGMLDLVVGAPGFDGDVGANQGRVYLLTSASPVAAVPPGCGGSAAGGGGGGGGVADGGGDEATPPEDEDGDVVIARVLRRLVLKTSHTRVRKFASFGLRGRLTASANRSVCQRRQKIALQRRKKGGRFQTFEVAVTRANGVFRARAIAERTYTYRARVSQTARCMGALSKTARVSVVRKSSRR